MLRDLYDENTCFSLNPKSAHKESIDALGYKDKKIIVHHDDNLNRMCNVDKKIKDIKYKELTKYFNFNKIIEIDDLPEYVTDYIYSA